MFDTRPFQYPWVLFHLKKTVFGISAENVRSMVATSDVARVPNAPVHVRGVVNLRGNVLPLMDLRILMNMPSHMSEVEDFCALMDRREADHRNWLLELESSVRQEREFTKTTDPHACAFGKWYDNYNPDSHILRSILRKFDGPHKRIHGIARKVLELEKANKTKEAYVIIEKCRNNELAEMVELFEQARQAYREYKREVCIVLEHKEGLVAAAVDRIEAVEHLPLNTVEAVSENFAGGNACGLIQATGRRKQNNDVVFLLDYDNLVKTLRSDDLTAMALNRDIS